MKIKLVRLDCEIDVCPDHVTTLQVEDHVLFARIVESLLSEEGEYAKEPYVLFDETGKRLPPKRGALIINALPSVPLNDRALISKLYKKLVAQSELNSDYYERLRRSAAELAQLTEELSAGMWGDYSLASDWAYESYLKAFGYSPITGTDYSLLDNCIRLFGLCADVNEAFPIVLVNAKSFFSEEELSELFEQAVFSGIRLLLLESWSDDRVLSLEHRTIIDQHFCVNA